MISYSWTHIKTIIRGRNWMYVGNSIYDEIKDFTVILTFFYEVPTIYTCMDDRFVFLKFTDVCQPSHLNECLMGIIDKCPTTERVIEKINCPVDIIRNDKRRCRNTMWFIEYLLVMEYDITNLSVGELASLKPIYHMIVDGLGDIEDQDYDDIMLLATMYYEIRYDEYKKEK